MKRLPEFIKELNNHRPTIKFDFNYSKTSTDYLDTTDYKTKGKISYEMFIEKQQIG